MSYFNGHKIPNITSRGDSAFIRYSSHPDGTDFTETWSEDQIYIGFATGQTAPKEKEAYTWAFLTGKEGKPGKDGLTPHIGENGNWWIGNTDTGNPSRGESDYEVAVRNGFEGTEEEWLASLTADIEKKAAEAIEQAEETIEELEYVAGSAQNRINDAMNDMFDRLEEEAEGFDIVQSTGDSITRVMSQKATTCELNNRANALKGTASGEIVALDDVSPLEHKVGVKLRSKNLFDIFATVNASNEPTVEGTTKTSNGLTCEVLEDGRVHAYGKIEDTSKYTTVAFSIPEAIRPTYPAGTYTGWETTDRKIFTQFGTDHNTVNNIQHGAKTLDTPWKLKQLSITVANNYADEFDVIVSTQLELGTTATAYTPYVADDTEVTLKVCGKNLFDISQDAYFKHYAISSVMKESDSIILNMGYSNISNLSNISSQFTLPNSISGKEITVSVEASTSGVNKAHIRVAWVNSSGVTTGDMLIGEQYSGQTSQKMTLTGIVPKQPDADHNKLCLYLFAHGSGNVLQNGETYTTTYSNIQVEIGNIATAYEPQDDTITERMTLADNINLESRAPNMTILTDTVGVVIEANYNKDSNIVIEKLTRAIISLGGNI